MARLPNRDRRYRTGRNQQINIKATPGTIERMNRYADVHDMLLGAVLEVALKALEERTSSGPNAVESAGWNLDDNAIPLL